MPKEAYPYPEDDVRISQLMAQVQVLDKKKDELAKELRVLIYKAEKPR